MKHGLVIKVFQTKFITVSNRVGHNRAETAVTLALWLFPIFCAALYLSIQQPHTLNKVQDLALGDVSKATWFQEMMA